MTVGFVHGNPETAAVWDRLAARLAEAGYEEQIRLSPPGFGSPILDNFGATVAAKMERSLNKMERSLKR